MSTRRHVVPLRQLIRTGASDLPDEFDLVADLSMPADWKPDLERTRYLRGIGMDLKDTAAWTLADEAHGILQLQVYFRSWLGHDLAFELCGERVSRYRDEEYNDVVQRIYGELAALTQLAGAELELTAADQVRMDLSGITYPTAWGERRSFEDSHYSAGDFLAVVTREWLSPVECRKCGQSEICRFPIERPARLREDEPCDVAVLGLETTVRRGWPYLTDESDFEAVVDALFRTTRFLADARFAVGAFVSDDYQGWLGDWQPNVVLSGPLYLRDELNGLSTALAKLNVGHKTKAILVEGESEHVFLTELMNRGQLAGAEITPYKGRGNLKNIKMLVVSYQERGYEVFLQGDLDGADPESREKKDFIRSFRELGVEPFMFQHDFESTFPRRVLVFAVARLLRTEPAAIAAQLDEIGSASGLLHELDLTSRKTELAKLLARAWHKYYDSDAHESEVSRWLRSFYRRDQEE